MTNPISALIHKYKIIHVTMMDGSFCLAKIHLCPVDQCLVSEHRCPTTHLTFIEVPVFKLAHCSRISLFLCRVVFTECRFDFTFKTLTNLLRHHDGDWFLHLNACMCCRVILLWG